MQKISVADINMMFANTLVSYGKNLVFFNEMRDENMALITSLDDGKQIEVTFDLSMFTAPKNRIGYVNLTYGAVYLSRNPVRRYKVGMHQENTSMHADDGIRDAERMQASRLLKSGRQNELLASYRNQYPSLAEALQLVGEDVRVRAFDKQFAVTRNREILYKGVVVGNIPKAGNKVEDIIFKGNQQHLQFVIGNRFQLKP